jgi:hypothetical protein
VRVPASTSDPPAPLDPAELREALRIEVGMLRARESRRVFDATVNVGTMAGERESFVARARDLPVLDTALRTDVVSSLLEQAAAPGKGRTVWLVRHGDPEPHDLDLRWFSAAVVAFGQHGAAMDGFFVIKRRGWLDPLSRERRVWKRLRL